MCDTTSEIEPDGGRCSCSSCSMVRGTEAPLAVSPCGGGAGAPALVPGEVPPAVALVAGAVVDMSGWGTVTSGLFHKNFATASGSPVGEVTQEMASLKHCLKLPTPLWVWGLWCWCGWVARRVGRRSGELARSQVVEAGGDLWGVAAED